MTSDSNPAAELLTLMQEWIPTPQGKKVLDHRRCPDGWWPEHVRAVTLLERVDARADELQVEGADQVISRLRRAVFAVDVPMNSTGRSENKHGVLPGDLTVLSLLAKTWAAQANIDAVRDLYESVTDARQLLIDAPELGGELQDYLLELVSSTQKALDGFRIHGTADIRGLVHELIGALVSRFPQASQQQRGKLMRVINALVNAGARLTNNDELRTALETGAKVMMITTGLDDGSS